LETELAARAFLGSAFTGRGRSSRTRGGLEDEGGGPAGGGGGRGTFGLVGREKLFGIKVMGCAGLGKSETGRCIRVVIWGLGVFGASRKSVIPDS
jgi:hypothetical protein